VKRILILVIVAALAWFGYGKYKSANASGAGEQTFQVAAADEPDVDAASFECDGRTMCSQMTSCAEATYFVQHCPDTKMDGNKDGVPCERQWCR
jgi:hypothetical protein